MSGHHDQEVARLDQLIATKDIRVVFQPIVDMETGHVHAFEALTRPGPSSGFGSPAELFAAADRCGRLWQLEMVSRSAAFEAAAGWPDGARLFLNSSPAVFGDDRFVGEVGACIRRTTGLTPDRIVLEITELSDESMNERLVRQATALKSGGFQVAIDDVGAGTSGLNRIVQIRPLWIKLDAQFVRNIHADPFRQNLVRFFVHFARLSNMHLVAEGIETADELAAIISLGVRFVQGFYLARPAAREVVERPEFAEDIIRKWRAVEERMGRGAFEKTARISSICEPVVQVPATATIFEAARLLRSNERAAGVLATDDQRIVGWVWRAHVEHAINDGFHGLLIGELMCAQLVRVMPRSTLQEAIEVACVFEDRPPADPLLVAEGSSIRGIVRLRDLIRTATREGHIGSGGRNLLAGFPTRVQADLHMAEAIEAWRSGAEAACPLSSDVAFIDVRRFADYNATFGYNVGDRLIRTIADLIESEILARAPGYFAAHLGDDRFIVCAPEGEIGPSLLRLIDRFEEFAGGLAESPAPVRGPVSEKQQPRIALPRPAIRVLLLNGPLRQVRHARELYQMERDLRDECRADEPEGTEIRSRLVMREMNRCDEHANGLANS